MVRYLLRIEEILCGLHCLIFPEEGRKVRTDFDRGSFAVRYFLDLLTLVKFMARTLLHWKVAPLFFEAVAKEDLVTLVAEIFRHKLLTLKPNLDSL